MPHPYTPLPPLALEELRRAVGVGRFLTDPLARHLYSYDGALDREPAAAVALPETTDEVASLVGICARHRVPFVPRGAGTSLSGGPIPAPGSLLISLTRMNRVLAIHPADLCAVVQPGLVNLDLQKRLEPLGLFYAPDPSSQLVSTLGGNLGHNAGGAHCLKYGVTANHLLAAEVVTPEGEVMPIGGLGADLPGYNLLGLYAGSEGTLGIVTEMTVRLTPLPEATSTALVIFDSLADASAAVADIIARGLVPAALEMMDHPLLEAVERTFEAGYPLDAAAVLLIDVDGPPAALAPQMAAIRAICADHQAREFHQADDPGERARLWRGRKGTAAAIANLAPGKISTDVSVPRDQLPEMLARMTSLAESYGLVIGNILHAGDGNLHPQIIFDPRDADEMRRVFAAQGEVIEAALSLGGSMTGEHGVGTEKRKYMPLMFSAEELALMGRVKQAFDPAGLCNPGKLLPDELGEPGPELPLPVGSFTHAAETVAVRDAAGRLTPYDYEAMAKLLALATREGQPVQLTSRPTERGPRQACEGREAVSTLGLHSVLGVDAANATVTAQAGVRVAELQAALAEVGQWWPVLPPGGEEATLGSVLASGRSGPLALLHGRLADRVTGVRLALPTGEIVRFGVSCVKNVAGYALERLLVGSQGTLAAILEVVLRTVAIPPSVCTQAWYAPTETQAQELGRRLLLQPVRPAGLEVLNPAGAKALGLAMGESGWLLVAAWHGLAEEVEAGVGGGQAAATALSLETVATPASTWDTIAALPSADDDAVALELSCPPSRCLEVLAAAQEVMRGRGAAVLAASPGLGNVRVGLPRSEGDSLGPVLDLLLTLTRTRGGSIRPLPPGHGLPLDSAPAPLVALTRRLKAAWDPVGILPSLTDLHY